MIESEGNTLPVFGTVARAWQLVRANLLPLARAGIVPLALLAISFVLYFQLFQSIRHDDKSFLDVLSHTPPLRILTTWLTGFLGVMTLLSLNVTWRRFLLGLGTGIDCAWFRKPFWKYGVAVFLGTLGFTCLSCIGGSLLIKLSQPLITRGLPAWVPVLVVAAGLLALMARLVPLFTEMLTDTPDIDLKLYRTGTKGSGLRLLAIWALTFLPVILGEHLVSTALGHLPSGANVALPACVLALAMLLCVILASAVAAMTYDFAVRRRKTAI